MSSSKIPTTSGDETEDVGQGAATRLPGTTLEKSEIPPSQFEGGVASSSFATSSAAIGEGVVTEPSALEKSPPSPTQPPEVVASPSNFGASTTPAALSVTPGLSNVANPTPAIATLGDLPPTADAGGSEAQLPAAAEFIEPDADDNDSTLGLADDSASDLNYGSVTSSIYNYRMENGRTYHAYSDGKYLIPNDDREQDRMDMVYHCVMTLFDGKPFFAPVNNPQRIVDMGTGTGIWALDVGDQYPEAHVIGIDLSPIQPKWLSPNVEFRIDDIEQSWVFDSPIDLVHSRLCSGNAIRSWPSYLSESFRCLRPGGWVEAQEFNLMVRTDDDSLPVGSKIHQWHELFHEGMLLAGCNMRQSGQDIKAFMEEAGFVNVHVIELKMPISPWPRQRKLKEAGGYAMLSILEDLTGMSLAVFTRLLGWDRVEMELFLGEVKKEWKSKDIHAYWPLYSVYGQKPLDAQE